MTLVWELQLEPREKLVLLALADNANDSGDCHPAVKRITTKTCLSESSVRRSIGDLEKGGHLTIIERPGRASSYRLHPCQPDTPTPGTQTGLPLSARQGSAAQTPVTVTGHPCQPDRTPLAHRQDTPVSLTPHLREPSWEPSREPSREPVQRFDPTSVAGLDLAEYERWINYRIEIRKPLKAASLQAVAGKLAALGADQAAIVTQSIENGWQGLFPLKGANNNGQVATNGKAWKRPATADEIEERYTRQMLAAGATDAQIHAEMPLVSLERIASWRKNIAEEAANAQH
jgi:hypothetical protein